MNKVVSDLKSLRLKEEDWDAISFFKSETGYTFLVAKYNTPQEYEQTELGYKYIMFHTDVRDDFKPVVEEAFIGDPIHVITNYTKAGCEGVFAKKTPTSKKILEKFIFGSDTTKKFEDFRDFVKEQE